MTALVKTEMKAMKSVTLLLLAHTSFPSPHGLFILTITSFQWEKVCWRAVIFYIRVLNEYISFYSFLFSRTHTIRWRKKKTKFYPHEEVSDEGLSKTVLHVSS